MRLIVLLAALMLAGEAGAQPNLISVHAQPLMYLDGGPYLQIMVSYSGTQALSGTGQFTIAVDSCTPSPSLPMFRGGDFKAAGDIVTITVGFTRGTTKKPFYPNARIKYIFSTIGGVAQDSLAFITTNTVSYAGSYYQRDWGVPLAINPASKRSGARHHFQIDGFDVVGRKFGRKPMTIPVL